LVDRLSTAGEFAPLKKINSAILEPEHGFC
jgi:hypothetical protein